jgi:hypothetical protein
MSCHVVYTVPLFCYKFILIRVTDMALDALINLLSKPYFPSNYEKNERDYHA